MQQPIVALAGRRIDSKSSESRRFPLARVPAVRESLRSAFEAVRPRAIVCAAACGADLVALATAGELGIRRRIVLPAAAGSFRRGSVVDRPGEWGELFDRVLAEVEAQGDLVVKELGDGGDGYRAGNCAILDETAALGEEREAWIVWDGSARGDDDVTLHFAEEARRRNFGVREILTLGARTG